MYSNMQTKRIQYLDMKKVIIIDDIKHVLERENSFLDRANIEVHPVPSNMEVLELHKRLHADLIITYLDMPDLSGEDLCDEIRGHPEAAKVSILMICPKTKECFERTKRCQANAFIPAPLDPDELLNKAQELMHIAGRAMYRAPASLQIKGAEEDEHGRPFLGFVENLSASGMLLGTDRRLRKNEIVICSFYMGEDQHLKVEAEVVRAEAKPKEGTSNFYGLVFKDVTPAIVAEIDRFIHSAAKEDEESAEH